MIKKIKNVIRKILNAVNLGGIVQLYVDSAIKNDGWFKSFKTKQAIDNKGNPIPWFTYPFLKFIGERLNDRLTVFEYGSGNSTIWFAERVKEIISVENDEKWFEVVKLRVPQNAKVVYRQLEYHGKYAEEIANHNKKFDIIIIDGRDRNYCAELAVKHLSDSGVIIFDNADLHIYVNGVNHLHQNGFKQIDFWGISPVTPHATCTSLFYRTNNCLNI